MSIIDPALAARVAETGVPVSADLAQSVADRAKAPWGRGEDGRPCLPMGAHWTDIPELVDEAVAKVQGRVDAAQPGHWYDASVLETWRAPGTVRTNVDGYQRTVGRVTDMLPADVALVLHAHDDLTWCLEMVAKLRSRVAELETQRKADHKAWQYDLRTVRSEREATAARIAELESERHSTNEALDDAVQALRAKQEEPAPMYVSRPLPPRDAVCARPGCGHSGEDHHHGDTKCWANLPRTRQRNGAWSAVPVCVCEGFVAEVASDGITRRIAPTQTLREDAPLRGCARLDASAADAAEATHRARLGIEDPHDGPLARRFRIPRDLPEIGSR